jgi:hypothetical protein
MPNGDPGFDVKELERFFSPQAAALQSFAQRHHLRLKKYYHQSPSWRFLFRHPTDGVAQIAVERDGARAVRILLERWYDDFDATTRFVKRTMLGPMPLDSAFAFELEKALSELLSWRFGDWDERHSGYANWKKNWTREQFLELAAEYPEPVP